MHVDFSQTGNGIGSLLMKKAIEFIRRLNFERAEVSVIAANCGARHF
jgi:L-amino acid N-acyltransferase YncA